MITTKRIIITGAFISLCAVWIFTILNHLVQKNMYLYAELIKCSNVSEFYKPLIK